MDPAHSIDAFVRAYVAIFFTVVACFYTLRITYKKWRENIEVVFPGSRYSHTWWAHMSFRLFRVAIWMVCLLRWPFPMLDMYIGEFTVFEGSVINLAGLVLLSGGFFMALIGQKQLGSQWRSGIDPAGPTVLQTQGLYRFSRNPMYIGVKLAQIGLFLALPSLFTLVCLIVGWVMVDLQLHMEERHLAHLFPDSYPDYKRKVRRWI